MYEDAADHARIGDGRHRAQPPAAVRAGQHVEAEGPAQQLGPGHVAGPDGMLVWRALASYNRGHRGMDPNQLPVADSAPYHDALAQCLDHWNLVPEKTSLLRDGVNHVFATETAGGAPVIVRVTDGGRREPGELDGELMWLNHLVRHGCTVTTPIPSRAGALLETIALDAGTYHVCCFERFAGREIDPRTDAAWNDELMLRVEIIDFDLGCYGWRVIDFAVPLFAHYYYPSLAVPGSTPKLAGNVLALLARGYRTEYRLDDEQLAMVGEALPTNSLSTFRSRLEGRASARPVARKRDPPGAGSIHQPNWRARPVGDLMKLHEILNYVVTAPAVEHWQAAMGRPEPPVAHSLRWIEDLWREGRALEVEPSS